MTPYESDDLTTIIEPCGSEFVVLLSPETADDDADYRELTRFRRERGPKVLTMD
jgi:hypothetical protein